MEISFCQDILFYILLHLDFHSISSGGEKWPSYPSHSSSNQKKPDLNVIDIFLITAYFVKYLKEIFVSQLSFKYLEKFCFIIKGCHQ